MKRKKPLISVIIPVHNEEKYIKRALSSIKAQSFKDYEVIVVADSCTDRTAEIAKSFGCRVIEVKTKNIGENRNIGASKAKADIFVFLDADVRVTRGYLKEVYRAVKNGYGCGRPYYFYDNSNFNLFFIHNITHLPYYPHTYFVTKKYFDLAGGYSKDLKNMNEDAEFSDRVNKICKSCVLDAKAFNSDRRFEKYGVVKEVIYAIYVVFCYFVVYKMFGVYIAPKHNPIR